MTVWAAVFGLWAIVALWVLAERAVATGSAYRALAGYANRRRLRDPELLPQLDDSGLVTHAGVLALMDPELAALFTPGQLLEYGDRGITARWYVRSDGQLFPSYTHGRNSGGRHAHSWPDGISTMDDSCPSWVFADTPAGGLVELGRHATHRARPRGQHRGPDIPMLADTYATGAHDDRMGWGVIRPSVPLVERGNGRSTARLGRG